YAQRPQIVLAERIGMQATPVNFDSQQFFQPDIGEPDLAAKMIQKGELTGLVGRFEGNPVKAESLCEAIRKGAVKIAVNVEQPDSLGGFARLYDQLDGAGIEPTVPLVDQLRD